MLFSLFSFSDDNTYAHLLTETQKGCFTKLKDIINEQTPDSKLYVIVKWSNSEWEVNYPVISNGHGGKAHPKEYNKNRELWKEKFHRLWDAKVRSYAPHALEKEEGKQHKVSQGPVPEKPEKKLNNGHWGEQMLAYHQQLTELSWWKKHQDLFVADGEMDSINLYNSQCRSKKHLITLGYAFQPIIGNPETAELIILSLNPGIGIDEITSHIDKETFSQQLEILEKQHRMECNEWYCLNPLFTGEYEYWKRHMLMVSKSLLKERSEDESFWRTKIASAEYCGYHSKEYKEFQWLHQGKLIFPIIRKCFSKKIIVIAKGLEQWLKVIPGLREYMEKSDHVFSFSNSNGVPYFAPGNLIFARDKQLFKLFSQNEREQSHKKAVEAFRNLLKKFTAIP